MEQNEETDMFQKQDTTSEKMHNKMEISSLPNKEFKEMVIKMFT